VRAVVSGGYDLLADQADIRTSLVSTVVGAAPLRPEIQLFTVGTPDALHRTLDVAALSSWLALRRIDRETQRLESLEREAVPAAPPALPASLPPANAAPPAPITDEKATPSAALPPEPVPNLPATDVPAPERDPRRALPKPRVIAPHPAAAPTPRTPVAREQAAPLPPPIEVRPAPGESRQPKPQQTKQQQPKPRPPLVLTPQNPPRASF
jgi:large subunit ribosomal protein L24